MDLLCEIKRDLYSIKLLFPNFVLAFLKMVPRLLWPPLGNLFYLDEIQRHLNRTIHFFWQPQVVYFIDILSWRVFFPGLFRADLVHLSDIGLDVFNVLRELN